MKISLAQLNPRIGDLENNTKGILNALKKSSNSDLTITGELSVSGYPPLDLLDWPTFVNSVESCNRYLISQTKDSALLFGSFYMDGHDLRNTAILAKNGREIGRVNKRLLPNYNIFDERRYFKAATNSKPIEFAGQSLGISICEDAWTNKEIWPDCPYKQNVMSDLKSQGASILINLSASPYEQNKCQQRMKLFREHSIQQQLPMFHVNQTGANDELIFDGGSFSFNANGEITALAPLFQEALIHDTITDTWPQDIDECYLALCSGIRDYFKKSGFSKAVLGLSGGIDSALVLCLAAEALGADNVTAIAMPGPYSSDHSLNDAQDLAKALNTNFEIFPIRELFESMETSFQSSLNMPLEGLARQNAQARMRGQVLMNYANAKAALLITTGNKSELAVGYCTLYGDMCGAIGPIGDCPKQLVYQLCEHIKTTKNSGFPQSIIDKAPSAELAANQKDQDNLPPYDALDRLVCDYVENEKTLGELSNPLSGDEVKHWLRMIDINEYKRRQAPPVLRISSRSFGSGRRRPMAQAYNPSWKPQ